MTGPTSLDFIRSTLRKGKLRGSPDRRAGVWRMRGLDGGSTFRFGYRIRGGDQPSKSPQIVTMELIDQSGVLFATAVDVKFIYPELIDNEAQLFQPSVNQKVMADLIDQTGVLFNVTFPVAQTVTPNLIDQSGVLFAASVASLYVYPQLIDNEGFLFSPRVNYKVLPDLIDQSGVLFVAAVDAVQPDLIDQSGEVYDIVVTIGSAPDQTVSPDLIDQTGALGDIAASLASGQTVEAQLIDQFGVLFTPSVRQPVKPLIALVGRYMPTIEKTARHKPTIRRKGTYVS